jgi:diaminohydroxyphosphoribosylaminopyrimidine deaminase / 5-amino-6-(5-phosphoribosylamino)uracil reductase
VHLTVPIATAAAGLELHEARIWGLLRALAARANAGRAVTRDCGVRLDDEGNLEEVGLGRGWLDLHPGADSRFRARLSLPPSIERMLELYLPLCIGISANDLVIGHIGQSLDGQIATSTGASCFITGEQDLVHTHRLRALFDAVLVGRATVDCDNPRLTTRLVAGQNPTRVVVDPSRRCPVDRQVFVDDAAPTLLLCAQGFAHEETHGHAEVVEIEASCPFLLPQAILARLRQKGLRRVFIEGGGVTISHFLKAALLDRLHIAVSPIFLGLGRPGLSLPQIDGLDQAIRPRVRRFVLGEDVLFDCAFSRVGE